MSGRYPPGAETAPIPEISTSPALRSLATTRGEWKPLAALIHGYSAHRNPSMSTLELADAGTAVLPSAHSHKSPGGATDAALLAEAVNQAARSRPRCGTQMPPPPAAVSGADQAVDGKTRRQLIPSE